MFMKSKLLILVAFVALYYLIRHPLSSYIGINLLYLVTLLVTFLHEFGHSFFALMTGGWVQSIHIDTDWSWFAVTYGWFRPLVLIGWYIGSAIFWNILLYIWLNKTSWAQVTSFILAGLMFLTSIFLFNSIEATTILMLLSLSLVFIARNKEYNPLLLQFIWVSSLLYIIEDFNVWPTSDLEKFANIFTVVPTSVWMYSWLILVIYMTYKNIRSMLNKKQY